jgi:hypothetical protein
MCTLLTLDFEEHLQISVWIMEHEMGWECSKHARDQKRLQNSGWNASKE